MQHSHHNPTTGHSAFRGELIERRRHLEAAAVRSNAEQLFELLDAVDSALERMDDGSFGICDVCHEAMGEDRLMADPLARVCLECLSPNERRALEYDLELASSIQKGLLPSDAFETTGWEGHYIYEPQGAVSGDFCDVVHDGGTTFVLFGDVAGKGVAAALLMSHLSAIFRGLVGSGLALVEIMGHANRMFCAAIPVGSYATLVAARLLPDGSVEISNAGHVPPLYHNGRINQLPPDGVPLGLFCESAYTSPFLHLTPGERLVLATDGVIESTDADDCEYGIETLSARVAESPDTGPHDLAKRLVSDVRRHRAGLPATDDTTLMVIRRKQIAAA
jgi:sigma-B regulation protein RsbU (phosphoserine phosphatase)